MPDTQYELFRDLDRHCVAGGVQAADCLEAVRRKRACIESALNRDNPLVREVLSGQTTFAAIYDEFSRKFRGVRRFLPMPSDEAHNQRLEHLARIVPNVQHFTRRSVFAADNPVTCAIYGIIASLAVALVWRHLVTTDTGAGEAQTVPVLALACGFGVIGFLAGLFSALRHRTRNPHKIHAREAALYLDLNYNCCRTFDDEAWAKFIALKTTPPGAAPLTPASGHPPQAAVGATRPAPTT